MADEDVDELLSPFEKMKVQVANHESVIVLRCSMALVNHNIKDPLSIKTLFSKVKKHINVTCVDIFRNVLTSKEKLFGSTDDFKTVFLKPSKVCLLQEMLASCANNVPKKDELSSFHTTVTEHKFELKANKNSLDFTNLCGQYFGQDGTFVPKFQRKNHHVGIPFVVPGNLKLQDQDWLLVSMRFSIKANLQFGCEIHTAKVIREVKKKQEVVISTPPTKVSQNVLVHSIFAHILTSSHQQMRMKDVRAFLFSEMGQKMSDEELFALFIKFPSLFHVHKDSNKKIVSIKRFNLNSVTEYLTLGDNVKVETEQHQINIPASKGVEMAVKSSRTETIMSVTNLSGLMALKMDSFGQETWKVLFKLDQKSEKVLSMPCSRGSFHNSISRSSNVTFNLQKKLCNKNKTEVKFGIVPGKHKDNGKAGPNSSKNKAKTKSETKQTTSKMLHAIQLNEYTDMAQSVGPSSSQNALEKVLAAKLVFTLASEPSEQLPYEMAELFNEEKYPRGKNRDMASVDSIYTVDSDVDDDRHASLRKEVVVTKLVFALLSKPHHQSRYNVSKLFYENFLGEGRMKDYFSIIQDQNKIFRLQDNKLGLQEDWLKHFVLLGDNMKVGTTPVSWASTSQIPTVEVSKTKSANYAFLHLPQAITIKNIPVVLHPPSSEDPSHQHLDMKLDIGRIGTIQTFCKRQQLQYNSGTVTLSLHLKSVLKTSCINFVVSNGKKPASKEKRTDDQSSRSDKSVSPVNTLATSAKTSSLPEELAAIHLIFSILSTGSLNRNDLDPNFDVCLERFPNIWDINQTSVGLASSWVEAMLPLALNVTETDADCPAIASEVEARLTTTLNGNPKLIIPNITAVVEDRVLTRRAFKRVFKLSKGGPTFAIKYSSKAKSLSSKVTLSLSLCLKTLQETSQIILMVTDNVPKPKTKQFQRFEDSYQDDFDEEDEEPFLSSKSPNVITIGEEDVEVETAEDALNVDNSDISSRGKRENCTLS